MYPAVIHNDHRILVMVDWVVRIHLLDEFQNEFIEGFHIECIFDNLDMYDAV